MKALFAAAAALALVPFAAATEVKVSFSEDFREELEDNYGLREGEVLTERVTRSITREFERSGVDAARVEVTIVDAKPNKPTMQQLGDEPGLDYGASISIGGMDLSATVFDASGNQVTALQYDWFETDIRNAGFTTWADARRASDRFARKLVRQIAAK